MEAIPYHSEDLIRLLDKAYPPFKPAVDTSMTIIQRKAGQRDVVDGLLAALKRATEGESNV